MRSIFASKLTLASSTQLEMLNSGPMALGSRTLLLGRNLPLVLVALRLARVIQLLLILQCLVTRTPMHVHRVLSVRGTLVHIRQILMLLRRCYYSYSQMHP